MRDTLKEGQKARGYFLENSTSPAALLFHSDGIIMLKSFWKKNMAFGTEKKKSKTIDMDAKKEKKEYYNRVKLCFSFQNRAISSFS